MRLSEAADRVWPPGEGSRSNAGDLLFVAFLFFAMDSMNESDKPCLGTDTAQAGGGGALVGYAVGSHDLAALTRAVPLVGGGLLLRKAFSSEESKTGCKAVAALAGAIVGHRNSYKDADPNSAAGSGDGGGCGDDPFCGGDPPQQL